VHRPKPAPFSSRRLLLFLQQIAVYSPVLIAILIMLPRLLSPQFGLFDDGKSMITAQQISRGDWSFQFDTPDGRFRPVYWLSFALVYLLFGLRPFWFFLVNALVLAGTAGCLVQLILNLGKGRWQAWLTGMLFVLACPVIENYYTLSKGEPWQLFFLALSLLVASRYRSAASRWAKVGRIGLIAVMILLANLAKETSVLVAAIALVWYLADRLVRRKQLSRSKGGPYRAYLAAGLISAVVFLLMRTGLVSGALQTQGYTNYYIFTLGQIQASLVRWSGWLVRDFAYLAPLVLGIVVLWVVRKKLSQAMLMFQALVWAAAWVAVFLPWYFMAEYYMLPAAFGLAVFSGTLLTVLAEAWKAERAWVKWFTGLALGIFALLFILVLPNEISSARIQLAVDAANAETLRTLAEVAPQDSTVLVNIQVANEYVDEIAMQLAVYFGRSDLVVEAFRSPELALSGTYYILAPQVNHQPLLTDRMGVVEATQNDWNASLQAYIESHPGWQVTATVGKQFRLFIVDLPRLLCPLIKTRSFCATPSPLVDLGPFTYGWTVYSLVIP
jgi:hypothetical protein